MATLYITEFLNSPAAHGRAPSMGMNPAVATQTVSIGGASTASAAFNKNTNMVRIHCDVICSIMFSSVAQMSSGVAPTAASTSPRMAANQTEYYGVLPGMLVAVITNS